MAKPARPGHTTYLQSRAVIMEPEEKKALALMQQIQALRNEKTKKREEKKREQREVYEKKKGEIEERKEGRRREERNEGLRISAVKAKRAAESQGGRPRKKKREE